MTFIAVAILYAAIGHNHDSRVARDESPRTRPGRIRRDGRPVRAARSCRDRPKVRRPDEYRRCDHAVRRRHDLCDFRGGRFRCRLLGSDGGRRGAWEAAARSHRPLDRPGVGSEPCVVDLRLRRLVDVLPRGVRVDYFDNVRTPDARGVRHRATRRQFCFSESGVSGPCPAPLRSHLRRLFGPGALLLRRCRRRDRLRAGAGWWSGRRSVEQLDQPNLDRR